MLIGRRLLKHLLILLLLLSGASDVNALSPLRGGAVPSSAGLTAIKQLMATMPANSIQLLNGPGATGGQPGDILEGHTPGYPYLYGTFAANGVSSGCYWSYSPGPGCPDNPAGSDPFPFDSTMDSPLAAGTQGLTYLCYTAPTFSMAAGNEKVVILEAGGHACNTIGTVFTFSLEAAAAALNAHGGWGTNPVQLGTSLGLWAMPVKPTRLLSPYDARPSFSSQTVFTCTASWVTSPGPTQINGATITGGSTTMTLPSSVTGLWQVGQAVGAVSQSLTPTTYINAIDGTGKIITLSQAAAFTITDTVTNASVLNATNCVDNRGFRPEWGNEAVVESGQGIAAGNTIDTNSTSPSAQVWTTGAGTLTILGQLTASCTGCTIHANAIWWVGTNNDGLEFGGGCGHSYQDLLALNGGRYFINPINPSCTAKAFGGVAQQYLYDDQLQTITKIFSGIDSPIAYPNPGWPAFCPFGVVGGLPAGVAWDPTTKNLYCSTSNGMAVWSDVTQIDPTMTLVNGNTSWFEATDQTIDIPDPIVALDSQGRRARALYQTAMARGSESSTCRGITTGISSGLASMALWVDVNDYASGLSVSCLIAAPLNYTALAVPAWGNPSNTFPVALGGLSSNQYDPTRGVIFFYSSCGHLSCSSGVSSDDAAPYSIYTITPSANPQTSPWLLSLFETASICTDTTGTGSCAVHGPPVNNNTGGPPGMALLSDGTGAIIWTTLPPNQSTGGLYLWKF